MQQEDARRLLGEGGGYRDATKEGKGGKEDVPRGVVVRPTAACPIGHGMLPGNNYDGTNAMLKAACYGNINVVKMLVKEQLALEPRDANGHTALQVRDSSYISQ